MAKGVLTLRVEPELVREVDALARRAGTTRSRLLRAIVQAAVRRDRPEEFAGVAYDRQPMTTGTKASPPATRRVDPDREEWLGRRVRQLRAKGMTTPLATREAVREFERR